MCIGLKNKITNNILTKKAEKREIYIVSFPDMVEPPLRWFMRRNMDSIRGRTIPTLFFVHNF